MPFTVAHAFYALPIRYIKPKYFSATGLILGSMSPDLEYFLHLEPYRSIGHTWQGLWLQALPLSIILAALFHYVVKKPLSIHLPGIWQLDARCYAMLQQEQLRSWRAWSIFVLSAIIGFVTHITLDEWTHAHSSFIELLPWIWNESLLSLPIYKVLQYSTSLVGLIGMVVILLLSLSKIKQDKLKLSKLHVSKISSKQKLMYWSIAVLVAIVTTLLKLAFSASSNTLGILVVAPISGLVLGIVVASLAPTYQAFRK